MQHVPACVQYWKTVKHYFEKPVHAAAQQPRGGGLGGEQKTISGGRTDVILLEYAAAAAVEVSRVGNAAADAVTRQFSFFQSICRGRGCGNARRSHHVPR